MNKEVTTSAADLEALMDDLEAMIAAQGAQEAQAAAPVAAVEATVVAEVATPEPVVEKKLASEPSVTVYAGPVGDTSTPILTMPAAALVGDHYDSGEAYVPLTIPVTLGIKVEGPVGFPADTTPAAVELMPVEEEIVIPDERPAPEPEPVTTPVYSAPLAVKGGLAHYVDVRTFQKDTLVTERNLDQAMMEQAGMRAFYGAQAAYAEGQASRTKAKFEILEAKLYDEHRKRLSASGEKTTDKAIEAAVHMDPRWFAGKNAVIEAETIAQVNKGLTFSLADRRDMLIQLGADRREEFKGQVRVSAQEGAKQSLTDRAMAAGRKAVQHASQ